MNLSKIFGKDSSPRIEPDQTKEVLQNQDNINKDKMIALPNKEEMEKRLSSFNLPEEIKEEFLYHAGEECDSTVFAQNISSMLFFSIKKWIKKTKVGVMQGDSLLIDDMRFEVAPKVIDSIIDDKEMATEIKKLFMRASMEL